jgi:hypothetical protein
MNTSYHVLRLSTHRGLLLVQCITRDGGNPPAQETFLLYDICRPHEAGKKTDFIQVSKQEAHRVLEMKETDDRGSLPVPSVPFGDMGALRAWFEKERGISR